MKKSKITFTLLLAIASVQTWAMDDQEKIFKDKIASVLAMEHRTEKDKTRDENRNPVNAISFIGLKEDMTVIEFGPGDGWYTKILGPLLKDKGQLHVAFKNEWLDGLDPALKQKGMENVMKLPIDIDWDPDLDSFAVRNYDFVLRNVDMVLNIREYHGFTDEGKKNFNDAAFKALKPGGTYVVVDHTRRHMEKETHELRRREDPVQVILEIQAAGFILEKSSDMFYHPDDELRYEVGRRTVKGNTDRFFLTFKKPN